jgi:hypothetical protein
MGKMGRRRRRRKKRGRKRKPHRVEHLCKKISGKAAVASMRQFGHALKFCKLSSGEKAKMIVCSVHRQLTQLVRLVIGSCEPL